MNHHPHKVRQIDLIIRYNIIFLDKFQAPQLMN